MDSDEVLSLNPQTLELEWSKIKRIIIRDKKDDEKMYHFNKSHLDCMVTSGHRMFVFNNDDNSLVLKNDDLVKSERIASKYYIPRKGYKWNGEKKTFFVLPSIKGKRFAQPCIKEEIKIPLEDWLDFFGLWLADGYCRHTINILGNPRKTVGIKQMAKGYDIV